MSQAKIRVTSFYTLLAPVPGAKKTKTLLEEMGVDYYFGDVDLMTGEEKQEAMKIVKKWNPNSSFPTLIIDDKKTIAGFQENKIKEELGK